MVILSQYGGLLLRGAVTTLWISWLALILSALLGSCVGLARTSRWFPIRFMAQLYAEFFRSIPTLVQLFFVYFGLSFALNLNLSPFVAATLGLGLEASALMSEVVRSGLQSIGKGQWDAAISSGFGASQAIRYVIWPQAFRVMIPPAVGIYVSTLKASSLTSVIGYVELTKTGLLIRDSMQGGFTILCAVATIYVVINYSISLIGARLERRFGFVS